MTFLCCPQKALVQVTTVLHTMCADSHSIHPLRTEAAAVRDLHIARRKSALTCQVVAIPEFRRSRAPALDHATAARPSNSTIGDRLRPLHRLHDRCE